jgi:bacterioferritin (cytochrome b1)
MSTTTSTKTEIDTLNSLLRGELAAMATHEMALKSVDGPAAADADQLLRFASDHRRSAETLKATVSAMGGTPDETAGVWDAVTRVVQGSADLFGDRAAVKSLLEGEEHGLSEYEKAVESVQPDIRRVILHELIPRQRKHISALAEIQQAIRQSP